jgi:hypothetical protein
MISRESRSRIASCPSGWGHMGSGRGRCDSNSTSSPKAIAAKICTMSGGVISPRYPPNPLQALQIKQLRRFKTVATHGGRHARLEHDVI